MNLMGVMINSESSVKLAEFYTKAFGGPVWHQGEWYGFSTGDNGVIMIGPHSEIHGSSKEPARVMISLASTDVKADFEHFKSCGATVVAEPYQPDKDNSPKAWLATLADTDGNYLQLATPWDQM